MRRLDVSLGGSSRGGCLDPFRESRPPRLTWRVPNEWPPAVAASVVLSLMRVLTLMKRQSVCQSASTPLARRQCQVRSRPPACSVPPDTSATRRHHHHHHHRHPCTIANTSPTTTTCYSGCYGAGRVRTSCLGDDELQPPGVQRPPSWLVLQTNQQLLASAPVGRSARPTNWSR